MKTHPVRLYTHLLAILFVALCFADISQSHEGGHGSSTETSNSRKSWTFEKTKKNFHGSFLSADEKAAKFETGSGKVIEVSRSELSPEDRRWISDRLDVIYKLNQSVPVRMVSISVEPSSDATDAENLYQERPAMFDHFKPFEKTLGLRWDNDFFYVESNGIPEHPMMTGITAESRCRLKATSFGVRLR
jgi:hypothetical protein